MRASFAACLLLAAGACGVGDDAKKQDPIKVGFGDKAVRDPVMAPGDVKITSTDNTLVLSVIGDTVRMQLSDSLRNSVTENVDSSMKDKGAISSAIAKSVASVVNSAMGFVVAVNANDIEHLRYENGHILFEVRNGAASVKTKGDTQGKAVFSQSDALKFMMAVQKQQAKSAP